MLKKQSTSSAVSKGKYYTYNIMLGSQCNWNCPYCIQTDRQFKQVDPNIFCDNLLTHLEKTNRIEKINTFSLWGGEPLLYYKSIATILDRLKDIPIRDFIRITSNGSLLNQDNYSIFNQYPTRFEISYHQGQLTPDKWKIALKINKLVISSLINHKVLDWSFYFNRWQQLCDTYGRCVKWYIFPMINAGNVSSDYALTIDDIDLYVASLYKHLNDFDNVFYKTAFEGLIFDASAKGLAKYGNYCYNPMSIAIDMHGNRYSCHHDYSTSTCVGNIFNSIPITWKPQPSTTHCTKCKAYPICVGGCFRCKNINAQCYYYQKIYDLLQVIKREYIDNLSPAHKDLLCDLK